MSIHVYMLRCADGHYYVGSTRDDLNMRIEQHQQGIFGGYTARRRPVTLVYQQEFQQITDAIAAERQIKGWTRAKKEALIAGSWNRVSELARRKSRGPTSFEMHPSGAPQDEVVLVSGEENACSRRS